MAIDRELLGIVVHTQCDHGVRMGDYCLDCSEVGPPDRPLTLEDRRMFMVLPMETRRRILAAQTEMLIDKLKHSEGADNA